MHRLEYTSPEGPAMIQSAQKADGLGYMTSTFVDFPMRLCARMHNYFTVCRPSLTQKVRQPIFRSCILST